VTAGESSPVGADLSVRVAGVGLLILACGPAWVARSALATIPGDYDGGPLSHVAVAVPAFALAVGMVYYGLQVWGVRAVWCGAAAARCVAAFGVDRAAGGGVGPDGRGGGRRRGLRRSLRAALTRAQGRGMVEGACRAASSKRSKLDLKRKALKWLNALEA